MKWKFEFIFFLMNIFQNSSSHLKSKIPSNKQTKDKSLEENVNL